MHELKMQTHGDAFLHIMFWKSVGRSRNLILAASCLGSNWWSDPLLALTFWVVHLQENEKPIPEQAKRCFQLTFACELWSCNSGVYTAL